MKLHDNFIILIDFVLIMLFLSSCSRSPVIPTLMVRDMQPITRIAETASPTMKQISSPAPTDTPQWLGTLLVGTFEKTAQIDIAKALFIEWLEFYKTDTENQDMRLSEFRIERIEIPDRWQYCASILEAEYIASVFYSVKPVANPPIHWAAGSGTYSADNWVVNKTSDIALRKAGSVYQMKLLGVPPC